VIEAKTWASPSGMANRASSNKKLDIAHVGRKGVRAGYRLKLSAHLFNVSQLKNREEHNEGGGNTRRILGMWRRILFVGCPCVVYGRIARWFRVGNCSGFLAPHLAEQRCQARPRLLGYEPAKVWARQPLAVRHSKVSWAGRGREINSARLGKMVE
jgi:hypothetical protein